MSGAGFFRGHDVPGEDGEASRPVPAPTACSSTAAHGRLGRGGGDGELPAGRIRRRRQMRRIAGPGGHRSGCDELGVDRGLAPVPSGEQLALALRVGGQPVRCDELGGQDARHPLLAAADLHLLA